MHSPVLFSIVSFGGKRVTAVVGIFEVVAAVGGFVVRKDSVNYKRWLYTEIKPCKL